jgi:tripartite ATP-independent transporter DctP family solute receptor
MNPLKTRLPMSIFRVLLILLPTVCLTSCTQRSPDEQQASEHWRFAIEESAGSVQDAYAQKFKELIEERSNGEIKVTVYPYGTLGTSDQITELVDMGAVQFAMASPGHLGKLIPEVQVFLLHFVFSDDERVNSEVLNNDPELRAALEKLYAAKRMKLLSVYSEGWQVWTTKKPIRHPDDFKGVKFRVMTSPLLLAAYNAYGASATPLPYSEVYSALQLNMIDGQENPVFAIEEMSFYEVTDWMIFPKHAPFITTSVTNLEFFNALPPARQELVRDVVAELNDYILAVEQDYNRERLDRIRERNPDLQIIEELTPEERAAFRKASQPVVARFIDFAGHSGQTLHEKLVNAVRAAEQQARR